jgi:hypothetical protein
MGSTTFLYRSPETKHLNAYQAVWFNITAKRCQGVARKQDQRGEHKETRSEDDQTRVEADGEVNNRLAPAERAEGSSFSLEPVGWSDEEHPEDKE